jgi:sulfur-oxidizing protein SoxY
MPIEPFPVRRRSTAVHLPALFVLLVFALLGAGPALAGDGRSEATWNDIRFDLFGDTEIEDGSHMMSLETPYRAHDAAIVPFRFSARPGVRFESVAIVIDENPAPLAATFTFGPAAAEHAFLSRFRVNSYSWVRAVARTPEGRLYMVKNYVKASGGCSAPASKDMDQALASIGKMRFRQIPEPVDASAATIKPAPPAQSSGIAEGQIMIRHPNYSGLQMDQVTMLHIPAHFVDRIEILHGDKTVMTVEGGISISEDPNIRFFYRKGGPDSMAVRASDTEGQIFAREWHIDKGSGS